MIDNIKLRGIYTLTFRDAKGNVTHSHTIKNRVVDTGLALFASSLVLDYVALGDSATAVVAGDTTLVNETERKAVASSSTSGNKKYISVFFGLAEAVGTINEVGSFSGGSLTADSGTLFSRISTENAELPITKTGSESLTIDYEVEVINA
ncbi:MAG: hypothetical protein KAT71_08255 [Gammaproteobacteria bacterium]|nr:hypothetical protein [Gammaproteobacteria bacterium]